MYFGYNGFVAAHYMTPPSVKKPKQDDDMPLEELFPDDGSAIMVGSILRRLVSQCEPSGQCVSIQ